MKTKKHPNKIPRRYIPLSLSKKDKKKQQAEIIRSRKAYKKGIFKTRKRIQSFHSKKSSHVQRAKAMYNVDKITANSTLAKKTQCTRASLEAILRKGRGAYYSSGSRPNQTAESWARARLASAITHGKASLVDKDILLKGCTPSSPVF